MSPRVIPALFALLLVGLGGAATAQNTINVPQAMSTTQVSVLVTATLVETNRSRASVTLENLGTNQVCFGPTSAVTLANGICLPGTVGAALTIPFAGAVYGIATTGTTTIAVMDLY
jgi:archaellum component FlaF (FlaF/FlaG flagellin family)